MNLDALLARARRIESETTDAANTARRVGSLLADLIGALRSISDDSLSSLVDDEARGHIIFARGLTSRAGALLEGGLQVGTAAAVDASGRGTLQSLVLREWLEVPELRLNRTAIHLGASLLSPGAGIVAEVEVDADARGGHVSLKLEAGEAASVVEGDLLMGIFSAPNAEWGAVRDADNGRLDVQFAGFATAYFEVAALDADRRGFRYTLREGTHVHPRRFMTFASRGNRHDAARGKFCFSTRSYTRYLSGVTSWEITASHVVLQLGELDTLRALGFSAEVGGVGLYAENAFLSGRLRVGGGFKTADEIVEDQTLHIEYSIDGSTGWHATADDSDRFMRQRKGNGAWSAALPFGRDGRDGAKGDPGTPGRDGQDGRPGKDGRDGAKGDPGSPGKNGVDGKSYTPNLLDNSAFGKDLTKWWKNYPNAGITLDDSTASPVVGTRTLKILPNGGDHIYLATTIGKVLRPNTTYTFSVWAKQPAKASAAVFYVYGSAGQWEHIFGADGSWQRFTKTFTTPAEVKPDTTLCLLNFKSADPNYVIYFAAPKLEEGSTATAWTSSEADRKGADGKPGQNGLPGKDGADGRSSYTHVRYSADGGQTFTAATAEALEAAKSLRGAGLNLASTLHPAVDYIRPWRPNVSAQTSLLSQSELPVGAFRGVKVIQPQPGHGIFHFNGLGYAGGKHYTMSFWAKADAAHTLEFGPEVYGAAGLIFHHVALSTEWTFYQHTFPLFGDVNCSLVLFGKTAGTYYYSDIKFEEGDVATPWTPCALDAAVGTTSARYRGELISDQPVASINPKAYTWVDTKGEKGDTGAPGQNGRDGAKGDKGDPGTPGQNGKDGKPGVGVLKVVPEFATGSADAPTSGWNTTLPPWTKEQYLWKREHITYTDGRVEWTPQQRDDTWAHIGQLTDQANAATSTANSAKQTAENAYNEAVSDKKVTAAEQRAIIRARVESLKSEVYAEKARLEVQYTKVRLYQHLTPVLASQLMNFHTNFKGAVERLISACTNYLNSSPFEATDAAYLKAINPPADRYYTRYTEARDALNAALAESGSFEIGGRNLFGFQKGVWLEVLGGGLEAVLAPNIRGVRIRCTGEVQEGWGVRIRNLGFERPGYYTASATLVASGRAQGMMMADLCDQSVVGVALSASGKRMELSGRLNHYTTKADYNGFLDIACARQTELFPGDIIELRDLMIERGGVASTWCKAEEDVEWELANAEYLRAVFDQKAGIDGGLLFGSMLQMRDTRGDVTAYLNGLRAKAGDDLTAWRFNRPALALGVHNFAQSGETESIAFNFDGSGHLKNLYFNGQEEGFYMGSDPETSLVKFSTKNMPTIAELVANRTSSTTMKAETIVVEDSLQLGAQKSARSVGRLEVKSVNGKLQGRVRLRVTGQPMTDAGRRPDVVVMAWLVSEDGAQRISVAISGHYNVDGRTFEADLYGSTLPLGKYYIEIIAYPSDVVSYRVEYQMLTDWSYVAIADRGVYGIYKNGILAYENENRYAMFKDGRLVVKGDPEMPGVLVAGSAQGRDGNSTDYWGRKGNMLAKTAREAVGIYRINHYINHINYSVMITPIHGSKNLVATILRKDKMYVQLAIREAGTNAQIDADFDFTLLGRN